MDQTTRGRWCSCCCTAARSWPASGSVACRPSPVAPRCCLLLLVGRSTGGKPAERANGRTGSRLCGRRASKLLAHFGCLAPVPQGKKTCFPHSAPDDGFPIARSCATINLIPSSIAVTGRASAAASIPSPRAPRTSHCHACPQLTSISPTLHCAPLRMRQAAPVSTPADLKIWHTPLGQESTRCRTGRFRPASRRYRCSRGSISTSTRTPPSPTATPATSSQYLISLYPFVSAHRPSPAHKHTHRHTHTHASHHPCRSLPPPEPPPPIYVPHVLLPPGTSSCKHGPDVKGPRGRTQEKKH